MSGVRSSFNAKFSLTKKKKKTEEKKNKKKKKKKLNMKCKIITEQNVGRENATLN